MINDQAFNNVLENITDPKVKQRLVNIANGKIVKELLCLSKSCKGRLIGYVYADGMLEGDELRNNKGELISAALAIRTRLDGFDGVQCACGNDSRIALIEKDHLTDNGQPPTKEGMEAIFAKIQNKPARYVKKNGSIEVDGFIIQETK